MKPDKDLIIIGGGAAGLSAAQYGARSNLSTLLIEETALGGQALIIEQLENYPGFPDPISGFELTQRFEKQAKNFGSEFLTASVQSVRKEGNLFTIDTSAGKLTSYAVIIATGARHRTLGVPGEKELSGKGVSYCATCDGPFFRNQKMLVVGGGDAACDEAMFLSKLTDKIIHIHRRDRFRAQKALAERVLNNPHIEVRFNTIVERIEGIKNPMGIEKVHKVILKQVDTGRVYEEEVAAVFVFIGSDPNAGFIDIVEKDENGYIITDQRMQTNIHGIFSAGDVRNTPFRQLVVAAGEGAIAAHAASQYIDELLGQAY
ncbi:MAG: thioredoxin-disulfide reductase [Spirochaetales bacterium]|nr:thioredoxin-disulfide reductase [Spirochaetales bacterium]